jgi:hypothetical protein
VWAGLTAVAAVGVRPPWSTTAPYGWPASLICIVT